MAGDFVTNIINKNANFLHTYSKFVMVCKFNNNKAVVHFTKISFYLSVKNGLTIWKIYITISVSALKRSYQ